MIDFLIFLTEVSMVDTKRFTIIGLVALMIINMGANAAVRPLQILSYAAHAVKKHPYVYGSAAFATVSGAMLYRWYRGGWPFHPRLAQAANQAAAQNAPAAGVQVQPQTRRQKLMQKAADLFNGGKNWITQIRRPAIRPLFSKAYNAGAGCVGKVKPAFEGTVSAVKGAYRYFRPAQAPQPAQQQQQAAQQPAEQQVQPAAPVENTQPVVAEQPAQPQQPEQPAQAQNNANQDPTVTIADGKKALPTPDLNQSYKGANAQQKAGQNNAAQAEQPAKKKVKKHVKALAALANQKQQKPAQAQPAADKH